MSARNLLRQCLRDERGAEVLEYVVILGLIVLGFIAGFLAS